MFHFLPYFFLKSIKMPTRNEMFQALSADYPNIPSDMLQLLIDLYEKDKDWVEERIKIEKKKCKGRIPPPKTQLTLEDMEMFSEKMKEIPQGYGEVVKSDDA